MAPKAYIVIGAGKAGCQAVHTLRSLDATASITLIGEEEHPPYERPHLSKEYLCGTADENAILIRPAGYFEEKSIDLVLGTRIMRLDVERRAVHAQGSSWTYDRLLLATGASPRRIGQSDSLPGVAYLRTLDDARSLRARLGAGTRLVIVGSGLIGLELAAAARQLGCAVTVVERERRVASRVLTLPVSAVLQRLHESHGVEMMFGETVESIDRGVETTEVRLRGGRRLAADLVAVGIGVVPNVDLAQQAGLQVCDGIRTDRYGRTSAPDVFAAGDAASAWNPTYGSYIRQENWQSAIDQATCAARNMTGEEVAFSDVPSQWSNQFGHLVQSVGSLRDSELELRGGDIQRLSGAVYHFSKGRLQSAQAIAGGKQISAAKRLIGSQTELSNHLLTSPFDPIPLARGTVRINRNEQ